MTEEKAQTNPERAKTQTPSDPSQDTVYFPFVHEDFKRFEARLREPMEKTAQRKGKTVRVVLELPEEVVALAAWVGRRSDTYHHRPDSLPTDIGIPLGKAHKQRGRRWLEYTLCSWFRSDFNLLQYGIHPLLLRRRQDMDRKV